MFEDCKYQNVFENFAKICAIPHGSYHEKAISDYLYQFASEHGYEAVQDEAAEEAEEFFTGEEEEEAAVPLNSFSQQTADNGEIELSDGMIYEEDDKSYNESIKESYSDSEDSTELYMEPQMIKKNDAEYFNSLYTIGSDEDSDYKTDTDNYGGRRPIFYGNLGILITAIILLVVLAVLAYCIFYVPAKNGISASAYIKETFDTLLGR